MPYKEIEGRKASCGREVQNGTRPDSGHCTDLEGPDEEVNRRKLSTMVVEMGATGSKIAGLVS